VVLPKTALRGGGLAGLSRERRKRVALGNRQMAEGEEEPLAKPLTHPTQDRLGAQAKGTLEVAEHDQLKRRPSLPADVVDLLE